MRVLIPIDGSAQSARAFELVARRARRMNPKPVVELVNVQHPAPMAALAKFGREDVQAAFVEEGRRVLSTVTDAVAASGLEAAGAVRVGAPGLTLAHEAEDFRADMIVMGARGLSPVQRFLLGSVSLGVLEHARMPVLLTRGKLLPNRENLRVVLAVDGSTHGLRAAEFIAAHPDFFGPTPEIHVICVLPDYERGTRTGPKDFEPVLEKTRGRYEAEESALWHESVDAVLALLKSRGLAAEGVRLSGKADEVIAAYAKEHGDLIVMGSHGWGRIRSAVLGSTAAKTGARTELPLLLVHIQGD